MSKAVRWLVIELQHGAGGASAVPGVSGAATPTAGAGTGAQHGHDARFSEDGAQ
uniref:Uncharacterized protein n=1 Tax=Arundo donax TaxID=35708 RepID=A0A0A9GW32_ARUDO